MNIFIIRKIFEYVGEFDKFSGGGGIFDGMKIDDLRIIVHTVSNYKYWCYPTESLFQGLICEKHRVIFDYSRYYAFCHRCNKEYHDKIREEELKEDIESCRIDDEKHNLSGLNNDRIFVSLLRKEKIKKDKQKKKRTLKN